MPFTRRFPREPLSFAKASMRMLGALTAAAFLLSGCARATISNEIKQDGSWTRTLAFHGTVADPNSFNPAVAPEDVFAIPVAGGPWKIKREVDNDKHEVTITADRTLQPGQVIKEDIQVKSKNKVKPTGYMVNEATVRAAGPGKWEYRETLHWHGTIPADLDEQNPDITASVKKSLPAALATDANVKKLSGMISHEFMKTLFGPPDPFFTHIFSEIMFQPDFAVHRLSMRMGGSVQNALITQFGDKLTAEQRTQITGKLLASAFDVTKDKMKSKSDPAAAAGGKAADDSAAVALTYRIKLPGKVVSTNGELDPYTNEVYWALFPEAAAYGDVTLTAVCDTNQKAAFHGATARVAARR